MACERFRDALSDVAAGTAASPALEAHLGACAACRGELAALRQALALADRELGLLLSAEPPATLAARIRVAAAEREAAAPRFGWLWPSLAAAVALAIALFVIARGPSPETRLTDGARQREAAPPSPEPRVADATRAPQRSAAPPTPGPAEAAGLAPEPASAAPAARDAGARRGALSAPRPAALPEPEVLVPAGEADALVRLAASLRRRAVAPDSLLVADQSAPLPEPELAMIQPLDIVPIDPAETSGVE